MTERPCKPDADLKRLWRMLLPGTPFLACGAPKTGDAVVDNDAAAMKASNENTDK